MHHFDYRRGSLYAEGVSLTRIAREVGTPTYVYSRATLERHYRVLDEALGDHPHLVCFSVKACSNLAVLDVLARLGSGFDIVSGGELARVRRAGGDLRKVVFSGVGKTAPELEAALKARVKVINVESEGELERLDAVARKLGVRAPVSLRVNPDVDPRTHPYISTGLREHKFGVSMEDARRLYARARHMKGVAVRGVDCHIGSQLTELAPFLDALARVKSLVRELRADGHQIEHLDLGGGLGITYDVEDPPHPDVWGRAIREALSDMPDLTIIVEPGRVIAGNAGVLLTQILYLKQSDAKWFVVVDAGMNDLARPALYGAYHAVQPVREPAPASEQRRSDLAPEDAIRGDVVGPVCETGDFLARDRRLPPLAVGELLAVMSTGAYGFVMSSNYNSRTRPAEVLVDGRQMHIVRRRETVADLMRGESRLPPDPATRKRR